MAIEPYLNRMDELLKSAEEIDRAGGAAWERGYAAWRTSAENVIRLSFGPYKENLHWARFRDVVKKKQPSGERAVFTACWGVLQGARSDLAAALPGLRQEITAEVFDDLLEMAKHFCSAGSPYHIPAASLAGAVLEDALRKLHEEHVGPWSGDGSIEKYNQALYHLHGQGGFPEYDKTQQKHVVAWGGLRNDVDHHRFERLEDVDPGRVSLMIDGVRLFIARFLR